MLTIGLVTDIHFGKDTRFEGKLRKLSGQAPSLLERFVRHMQEQVQPDLVVNLGDVIEDEGPAADAERYGAALERLRRCPGRLYHVAGNHDTIHLDAATLRRRWGWPPTGPLYYGFDCGGLRFIVLHTIEQKDTDISIDAAQLEWLAAELDRTRQPTVIFMHHPAADQDLRDNRWFSRTEHIALLADRARFRGLLRDRGNVVAVFNGHLHWNHLCVADGIPYVTLQSLVENVDDDAPGRAAGSYAVVRLSARTLQVQVAGIEPARYRIELGS